MTENLSEKTEIVQFVRSHTNRGRWGSDDELGTVNLITPEKRLTAMRIPTLGTSVSLSRRLERGTPYAADTGLEHVVEISSRGHATDYYGMSYHGRTFTHIDALGHIFDSRGVFLSEGEMYNGRQALEEASSSGLAFGGIHALRAGIITRGVLLDIPALRGIPYVAPDDPVRESDLLEAASRQGISVEPGDGLVVYCGREAFETDFGMMGSSEMVPGLHTSCLRYLRNSDVGVLLWDMHDHRPPEYGFDFGVHFVLPLFGLPLVDNCSLEELVEACRRAMRYEFAVVIAPLDVVGGTGSPVNPLALL